MSFQIACQTLPWSELPFETALEGIKASGYDYMAYGTTHQGVEPVPLEATDAQIEAVRCQVAQAGLEPVMMFQPPVELTAQDGVALWRRRLEHAKLLGVPLVLAMGPWGYKSWPDERYSAEELATLSAPWFAAISEIASYAEALGVKIVLKPHTGITATAADCKRTVQRIGSPAVRVCYDGGNVRFYEGVDPALDIKLCAEIVEALCVKDHIGARANPVFPCPGDGEVDHRAMLAALMPYRFEGPVAVERFEGAYKKAEMPPELIQNLARRAREHLTSIAAELAPA